MIGEQSNLPRHVGIIMDGNGRWAQKRGLPRNLGHKAGAENLQRIIPHAEKRGISYLTFYVFSTENWRRSAEEVNGLMDLFRGFLAQQSRYQKTNLQLRVLGDMTPMPADIRAQVEKLVADNAGNTGMTVNFAFNYGGQAEILHAAKALLRRQKAGDLPDIDALTEEDFAQGLYTAGMPDADLIIRTSGELRTSNFLLWQGAYAEYLFPTVLWPDFSPQDFDDALAEYAGRSRRHGGR